MKGMGLNLRTFARYAGLFPCCDQDGSSTATTPNKHNITSRLTNIPEKHRKITYFRIGKTLLIDDFDIHQYLLRRSATEWEWLSNYFRQTILEEVRLRLPEKKRYQIYLYLE